MTVLAVSNSSRVPLGRLQQVLDEAGVPVATVSMHRGEMPARDEWDAVVVLGGEMGAYDVADHPWLVEEMEFVRWALNEQIPTLGICLGGQLIAHAAGGRAFLADVPEVGFVGVHLTDEGVADPVIGRLVGPVLAVHRDTFEMPAGATLMASSDRYPHAYRYRSALGVQFHPEADAAIVAQWIEAGGLEDIARRAGTSTGELLDAARTLDEEVSAAAKRFFAAWLECDVL